MVSWEKSTTFEGEKEERRKGVKENGMKTAVVGGGAAGFFLAVNLKEMAPQMEVTIYERSQHVLRKVGISGGGRCNCTNTFEDVSDLSAVYPRGHRLMRRLFGMFGHREAMRWFESHGVSLTVQADHCVFPASQDAQTIVRCFTSTARRLGIRVVTGQRIGSLSELSDYDFVAITTGGAPRAEMLEWLTEAGHRVVEPVPSLFSLTIDDSSLHALTGTVAEQASVLIPGTRLRAAGPLLITHWGVSGPAILRLSSVAARHLYENNYRSPLSINWTGLTAAQAAERLHELARQHGSRQPRNARLTELPQRLWEHLLAKSIDDKAQLTWRELGSKNLNRLANTLTNYTCQIAGRAPFKDEYVTCGGIALSDVNPHTMESRVVPRLFFAGEVLDIDGITGGFNFQAAWTTAYAAARGIAEYEMERQ